MRKVITKFTILLTVCFLTFAAVNGANANPNFINKILGIDISNHQKSIDWKKVSEDRIEGSRVEFSFMKASEANYYKDLSFKNNYK